MIYKGTKTNQISFPIGGIGTGSVGLSGNGRLVDWELFNRPNKCSRNGYTCFAVRAKNDKITSARILHGDKTTDLHGPFDNGVGHGFGHGADKFALAGMPHFKHLEFNGRFPVADLSFWDENFPGKVNLKAFNPFIPLHSFESSLPVAMFEVEFINDTDLTTDYSVTFNVHNPFGQTINYHEKRGELDFVKMVNPTIPTDDKEYGELAICCDDANAFYQEFWYRGMWQDNIVTFWNEFSSTGTLPKRHYDNGIKVDWNFYGDHASVGSTVTLKPNEKKSFKFIMSWYIPNCYNYWSPYLDQNGKDVTWKNYYATQFDGAVSVIEYCFKNYSFLRDQTLKFTDELFSSTLPESVIDAISSTMSVLKSPTVMRLENGDFYGWEGVMRFSGSCEGTCQHVWNYAYALCFLFPDLERSIRNQEFKYGMDKDGHLQFRLSLPVGREQPFFRACLDGQMGTVIKFYRDWKICGDDNFLKDNWSNVKMALEYAWNDKNEGLWDADKDGVLEGAQHNTLDMEVFGPSGWLQSFYLTALKAGAEMAKYLGENDKAQEYLSIYENGKAWCEKNLFNGEYFIHKVDIKDKSVVEKFDVVEQYWNAEQSEIKYQIAEGCDIDQLCGQWHAHIAGLGRVFDQTQIKSALNSIYKYNHLDSVRELANPWRAFAVNDESATLMFSYPQGKYKPYIPITYCEESMHGFEYQFAGLLFAEGLYEKGLSVVKGVRDRYDGEKRNPWNEMECGSNYARSMASFALLPILSGFFFDLPNKTIGFNPKQNGNFRTFFSIGTAWGNFIKTEKTLTVNVLFGKLDLCSYVLSDNTTAKQVFIDGKEIPFTQKGNTISFKQCDITNNLIIEYK
ncbi:MAG: hypothetical protein J6C62_09970 [Clostridia bacterium]|nr:hypothetical protein [Clostridia bacterium]